MRFTSPIYLLLLLVGCGSCWYIFRRARAIDQGNAWRRHLSRSAVALLLVLAAAGLEIAAGEAPLSVMFVMDASDSMISARAEMQRQLKSALAQLSPGDRAGLTVFGAEPVIERSLGTLVDTPAATTAVVSATGTDIEAAVHLARSALPATGLRRIVLLSDGQQTHGDALREAALAAADGIPIDIALPLETRSAGRTPALTRVSAPAAVAVGEAFQVSVVAEGPPGEAASLSIEREQGGPAVQPVHFSASGTATAVQTIQEQQPGIYLYQARLSATRPDPFGTAPESSDGAVVVVSGQRRVLHVGERPGISTLLSSAFVVRHISPMSVPTSSSGLTAYDAVILDDVRPDMLNERQTAALAQHVETRGGGLVVLGSADTLDAAALAGSGLDRLLPIDARPRAGTRASELALVVLFDKSGSMDDRVGGQSKIEYARQGVQRILDVLPPTDAVGVMAFDSTTTVITPLTVNPDAAAVNARLRTLEATGSTAIAPAVEQAVEWLSAPAVARIARRHILLVTDGRSSPQDVKRLQSIVTMARVPLSIISLGDDRDQPFLASLAAATGARAYFPEDARSLPVLAAREATLVAGGRVVEETFTPRRTPHPISGGLGVANLPQLGGYVVSAPKPGAELALASHRLDPILATWRYGLGKVAAYTADLEGPWSMRLRSSPAFEPLVIAMAQWIARSTDDDSSFVNLDTRSDYARLVVEKTRPDGSYASTLDMRASLRHPSGSIEDIPLRESMPGRYEAVLSVAEPGPYVVGIDSRDRDGVPGGQLLRGFYWSGTAEQRLRGVNTVLLSRVREMTGGTTITDRTEAWLVRPSAFHDMRPWLLTAAFLIFLGELLISDLRIRFRRGHGIGSYTANRGAAA